MLPFQQNPSPFGQNNAQQPNIFGAQNSQPFAATNQGGAPPNQSTQSIFGAQTQNPLQTAPSTLFGTQQASGSSTGANNLGSASQPATYGMPTNSRFGQPASNIQFGTSLGSSSQFGQSAAAPQPSATSFFGQPMSAQSEALSNSTQFGQAAISQSNPSAFQTGTAAGGDKTQAKPENNSSVDSHGSLISSIKENSVNLYNLTLQEILDRHTMILENNIKEFEKDAEKVFERDLQLIRNKNNFIAIQKKIAEENTKLDELSEALDFFEKQLEEVELGEQNEMGRVIEDFESICDRFYKKVESFKDEQGEVLDLVNEIYEIIDLTDSKLDYLVKLRDIK